MSLLQSLQRRFCCIQNRFTLNTTQKNLSIVNNPLWGIFIQLNLTNTVLYFMRTSMLLNGLFKLSV